MQRGKSLNLQNRKMPGQPLIVLENVNIGIGYRVVARLDAPGYQRFKIIRQVASSDGGEMVGSCIHSADIFMVLPIGIGLALKLRRLRRRLAE